MCEKDILPANIDIAKWVDEARGNRERYRDRQVTEILLTAIGLTESLRENLVLKGGTLMAIAFGSERTTGDVDFTTHAPPSDFPDQLKEELNRSLPRAASELGYIDLLLRVQRVEKKPRPQNFENMDFPALHVTIGSALRGTPEEAHFQRGQATRVLTVEISFNEQVYAFQELNLEEPKVALMAYSVTEIVSEKLRAILQQAVRHTKSRRQDVFDIAYILDRYNGLYEKNNEIFSSFIGKCRSRGIDPTVESIDDPIVLEKSQSQWNTLQDELDQPLPDFLERFSKVRDFYRSLPWHTKDSL